MASGEKEGGTAEREPQCPEYWDISTVALVFERKMLQNYEEFI